MSKRMEAKSYVQCLAVIMLTVIIIVRIWHVLREEPVHEDCSQLCQAVAFVLSTVISSIVS